MIENWQTKYQRLCEFIEMGKTNQTGMAECREFVSFLARDLVDQHSADDWNELKRASVADNSIVEFAEQVREWQANRTPNTVGYWAFEIIAISLEAAGENELLAVSCEQLTDGLIIKAVEDFPELRGQYILINLS